MKFKFYTLVNCIIIGCIISKSAAFMEDKILTYLEEIRNRMCYPLFGYPPLDPLQIEHADFNMDNKYVVNLTSSVTDFRLTGLSDFNVTHLKISKIPLKSSHFTIVLPSTTLKSLYTAKGSLGYIVNLNGDGKATSHIADLKLSITWIFKFGLTVGVRNLNIQFSLGDFFVDLENFMEEPRLNDFFHALINEMGIDLLNDGWIEAQERGFVKYAEHMLNTILGKYTLSDIIKIIDDIIGGAGSTEPPFGGIPADCKARVPSYI